MVSFRHFASYVTCALFVLCAIGCHSKQTPINKLVNFTEEIQNKAQDYTEEDWKASAEELEQIEKEIEQYKSEYTDEERMTFNYYRFKSLDKMMRYLKYGISEY